MGSPVTVRVSDCGMRLYISLVNRFGGEFSLDDSIGFAESLVKVTAFVKDFAGDVRRFFGCRVDALGNHSFMEQRSVVSHSFIYGQYMRQNLVRDLDCFCGSFGLFAGGGCYCSNNMSFV